MIWISILGTLPFALLLPHADLFWTGVLSVVISLIISSAFSSILIYAIDMMPHRVGLVGGLFYGLAFGLGGLTAAALGPACMVWPQMDLDALTDHLGASHGVIVKEFAATEAVTSDAARRYSPGEVVGVEVRRVVGEPRYVSTSYVERQNLTLRMTQKRFARLTNGFSKKLTNHAAAVSLYVSHYNLCRVHEALRITPAMQLGITDHIWTISELVAAALNPPSAEPKKEGRTVGRFTVIDGGRE